jgi:Ca-activated chloride channel family protein
MRMGIGLLCAATIVAAVVSPAVSQTPPRTAPRASAPTQDPGQADGEVQLHSDLVLVSAVVTKSLTSDKQVRGLELHDFTILDEGVPQEIVFFGGEAQPLDILFLFDASQSTRFRQQFQREALAAFLRTVLKPADRAAVFWFNDAVHVGQPFTESAGAVLAAIDRIPSGGATALYDAVAVASGEMRSRSGRRAIVILSDGRDTFSDRRLDEALASAQQADVVVYAINTSYAGWAVTEQYRRNDPLEYLASETGGEVFYASSPDEVEKVLSVLSSRLRDRYLLGFYPAAEAAGGRFRRIRVTVDRKNARVFARSGYYGR